MAILELVNTAPQALVRAKRIQAEMDLSQYSIILVADAPPYGHSVASVSPGYPDLPMKLRYWNDLYYNLPVFDRVITHELCHVKLWEQEDYQVTGTNSEHLLSFVLLAHEYGGECFCHPDRAVGQFISDHTKESNI